MIFRLLRLLLYGCLVSALAVGLTACGKKGGAKPTIVPPVPGAVLHFRGYVTDAKGDLVSKIYWFDRRFSHVDTVDGQAVYVCYSRGEKLRFATDEEGTLRQLMTLNLTDKVIPYHLSTEEPTVISYWQTVVKMDQGVGTEWRVLVDTTFVASDAEDHPVKVRYYYSGKARYEGWGKTFVPETQRFEKVLDVHWYEIENFIVNQTKGDSLFVLRGTAHHYFEPAKGLVKYITDYRKKELGKSYVVQRGTWELVKSELPES